MGGFCGNAIIQKLWFCWFGSFVGLNLGLHVGFVGFLVLGFSSYFGCFWLFWVTRCLVFPDCLVVICLVWVLSVALGWLFWVLCAVFYLVLVCLFGL